MLLCTLHERTIWLAPWQELVAVAEMVLAELRGHVALRLDAWTKATSNGRGPTLSSQAYKDLSVQSMNVAPFTYSSVEPGLFDKIVRQELPPGGPVATVLQWLCRVRLGPKREAMPYSNPSIDTLAVVISVGHAIDQSLPNSSRTTT